MTLSGSTPSTSLTCQNIDSKTRSVFFHTRNFVSWSTTESDNPFSSAIVRRPDNYLRFLRAIPTIRVSQSFVQTSLVMKARDGGQASLANALNYFLPFFHLHYSSVTHLPFIYEYYAPSRSSPFDARKESQAHSYRSRSWPWAREQAHPTIVKSIVNSSPLDSRQIF